MFPKIAGQVSRQFWPGLQLRLSPMDSSLLEQSVTDTSRRSSNTSGHVRKGMLANLQTMPSRNKIYFLETLNRFLESSKHLQCQCDIMYKLTLRCIAWHFFEILYEFSILISLICMIDCQGEDIGILQKIPSKLVFLYSFFRCTWTS